MIYLDYSANTPVDPAVLEVFVRTEQDYIGSIFHSIHAVNIETFPGYKTGGEVHSYLEDYHR